MDRLSFIYTFVNFGVTISFPIKIVISFYVHIIQSYTILVLPLLYYFFSFPLYIIHNFMFHLLQFWSCIFQIFLIILLSSQTFLNSSWNTLVFLSNLFYLTQHLLQQIHLPIPASSASHLDIFWLILKWLLSINPSLTLLASIIFTV